MLDHKENLTGQEVHQCKSYREGDWIVFYCPLCTGYEHKMNLKTDESQVEFGSYAHIRHMGLHAPEESIHPFRFTN